MQDKERMAEARLKISPSYLQQLPLFAAGSTGNNKLLLEELIAVLSEVPEIPEKVSLLNHISAFNTYLCWFRINKRCAIASKDANKGRQFVVRVQGKNSQLLVMQDALESQIHNRVITTMIIRVQALYLWVKLRSWQLFLELLPSLICETLTY